MSARAFQLVADRLLSASTWLHAASEWVEDAGEGTVHLESVRVTTQAAWRRYGKESFDFGREIGPTLPKPRPPRPTKRLHAV